MRRLLSILLLLVIGLLPIAPQLSASDKASSLPACCRKTGVHHCMGTQMTWPYSDQHAPSMRGRCSVYQGELASIHTSHIFLETGQMSFAPLMVHPTGAPQTEIGRRIAFSRSRQKRGPPVLFA